MTHNPYADSSPEGVKSIWEACHTGMEESWDPALADGMTWQEFDERSKTISISAYLNYESRQAPMGSEREIELYRRSDLGRRFLKKLDERLEEKAAASGEQKETVSSFLGRIISF